MKRMGLFFGFCSVLILFSCSSEQQTERLFSHFLKKHVEKIKPVRLRYNKAIWATYTGESTFSDLLKESKRSDSLYDIISEPPEYYQQLLHSVYENASDFDMLWKIKQSGLISDPLLQRQFLTLFREYVSMKNDWDETDQIRTRLLEHYYELKKTENQFIDSLSSRGETDIREQWIGQFSDLIGEYRGMIKAMNKDVQSMGYSNYFHSMMDYQEVSVPELKRIMELVDRETASDWDCLLALCQKTLCEEQGIGPEQLTPADYYQAHSEMIFPARWQAEYTQETFAEKMEIFFKTSGFDIHGILDRSDIGYDPAKINRSFFFCLDFDRNDMRIYSNSKPNADQFYYLIHELGHALHYQNIDPEIPFVLRAPHTIISEAVAMYFDSKLYLSAGKQKILDLSPLHDHPYFRDFSHPSRLFFLRKILRNIEFEMSVFENPDQDFTALWWALNKKYLHVETAPANQLPEWIANGQIIDSGGMHVFYLYALAVTAQLESYFPDDQTALLKERIMKYGDSLPWYELVEKATGEPLNMNYLFRSYRRGNQSFRNDAAFILSELQLNTEEVMLATFDRFVI